MGGVIVGGAAVLHLTHGSVFTNVFVKTEFCVKCKAVELKGILCNNSCILFVE
jgi:hypothetical protein